MDIKELQDFRLSDAIKFNDKLNPRIWGSDEKMLTDVREKLLAIADDFREFLGITDLEIKDITVSGSNAAYTYTPHSDIDLHLVVDLPKADASEVYRELFDAKKYVYNDQHDFKIGPYDIELYVQNANEPHHSQGIYSVLNNDWVSVPQRRKPKIDDISVKSKYEDIGARIDQAIASGDLTRMDDMAKRIREMRQAGLDQHGEFGPENLAFKVLRTNGTLERLRNARLAAKDSLMSLQERDAPKKKTTYAYSNYWFPGFGYYTSTTSENPESTDDGVNESISEPVPDVKTIIGQLLKFAVKQLELKSIPSIRLKKDPQWSQSNSTFGRYDPETNTLYLSIANRHIMDICRTMAHELVHRRQDELEDIPYDAGETGSDHENEANAVAGVIMRDFGQLHPEYFKDAPVEFDEGWKEKAGALAAAACIAGTPGCATTGQGFNVGDALRGIQTVGRTAQTMKGYGSAGAKEELMQQLKNELRRQQGQLPEEVTDEDYDPNGPPPGPETKPTMPKGTVRVDVSDVYDWYKLGRNISNLDQANPSMFGKGPPSTIISFGDEETEHKYIKDLEKLGLTTTDIDPVDPNQPKNMPRQKVDPTYNVNEATGYIPVNSKEAHDPRYSMAITQDIKPGEVQRQAAKMGFKTDAAGVPPLLMKLQNQLKEIKAK